MRTYTFWSGVHVSLDDIILIGPFTHAQTAGTFGCNVIFKNGKEIFCHCHPEKLARYIQEKTEEFEKLQHEALEEYERFVRIWKNESTVPKFSGGCMGD